MWGQVKGPRPLVCGRRRGKSIILSTFSHRLGSLSGAGKLVVGRIGLRGISCLLVLAALGPGRGGQPWAQSLLFENLAAVRINRGGYRNHEKVRLLQDGQPWPRTAFTPRERCAGNGWRRFCLWHWRLWSRGSCYSCCFLRPITKNTGSVPGPGLRSWATMSL